MPNTIPDNHVRKTAEVMAVTRPYDKYLISFELVTKSNGDTLPVLAPYSAISSLIVQILRQIADVGTLSFTDLDLNAHKESWRLLSLQNILKKRNLPMTVNTIIKDIKMLDGSFVKSIRNWQHRR